MTANQHLFAEQFKLQQSRVFIKWRGVTQLARLRLFVPSKVSTVRNLQLTEQSSVSKFMKALHGSPLQVNPTVFWVSCKLSDSGILILMKMGTYYKSRKLGLTESEAYLSAVWSSKSFSQSWTLNLSPQTAATVNLGGAYLSPLYLHQTVLYSHPNMPDYLLSRTVHYYLRKCNLQH